jgi:serine/threonine-protein kinase
MAIFIHYATIRVFKNLLEHWLSWVSNFLSFITNFFMPQSRQLAAIMFTDIVGYTALMGKDEDKAFNSLLQFKSIAQPLVEKYHGNWHKDLGDGALISFSNVLEAVHCAISIQKEVNSKTDFRLRIGIHLGDITFAGGDVFGDGVNIASRIQSEAIPGGICVSETIAKNIRNQSGMKAEYLGKRLLKNVDEPVVLYQLRAEGLIIRTKKQTKKISLTSVIFLVIATATITALLFWKLLRPASKDQLQVKRLNINLPAETPLEFIFGSAFAFSPDGKVIVYVGPYKTTHALFVRYLSSSQIELLPGTEGAYNPFFSPNGRWVGFFANDRLKKITLDKREPTEICRAAATFGACWTINGKIIFSVNGIQMLSVDESGGEPKIITIQDKKRKRTINSIFRPFALPDGNHILFNDAINNIYIFSLVSNELTQLPIRGIQPVYIPSGHIVYLVDGSIYVIRFDLKKMEISGNPSMVQDGLRMETESAGHYGIDQYGNLIYAAGAASNLCKLVWVDQNGKEDSLAFPPDYYGIASISIDGKKIAYTQTGVNGELILLDSETGRKTILNRTGFCRGVRWNVDNQSIGFASTYQSDELKIYSLSTSTGQIKPLVSQVDSFSSFDICDFSKDEKWIAFQTTSNKNDWDLWIKDLKDLSQPAKPLIRTSASEWALRFSPNSQFITYTSGYEVYVQGFPNADKIMQVSNGGGEEPVWTPSGRQVIYRRGSQWWMVDVVTTHGLLQPGIPKLLFRGPYLNCWGPSFDIAPDGRLLLLKPITSDHSTTELVLIENWFEELKRLAPAN